MRATRRRTRERDQLASPDAVRAVCRLLRERLPEVIPNSEKHLLRFLYAVRHVERRPATDTKRGRPSRWTREVLTEAAGQLRAILERETSGRVSLNSFIGQYLPILQFPSDITAALDESRVNLHEAAQLARLMPERLGCSAQEARAHREEILRQHLFVQGSQTRLRTRVKELLGEIGGTDISSEGLLAAVARSDELLEVDPSDARHMFWEEMKRLFFAMKEIEAEDLDEETMEEFLRAMDQISNLLYRMEKRKRESKREETLARLTI